MISQKAHLEWANLDEKKDKIFTHMQNSMLNEKGTI